MLCQGKIWTNVRFLPFFRREKKGKKKASRTYHRPGSSQNKDFIGEIC